MASNGTEPNRQPCDDNSGAHTTLCLKRVPISLTDYDLKRMTDPYGQVKSITWLNNNQHTRFTMAFIVYATISECQLALSEIKRLKPYGIDGDWAKSGSRRLTQNSYVSYIRDTMAATGSSLSLNNAEIPICARCQQVAGNACGKCGEWYCSSKCQSVDWNRHKKECFEMPRLIPLKSRSISQQNIATATSRLYRASDNVDTVDNQKLAKKTEELSHRKLSEENREPILEKKIAQIDAQIGAQIGAPNVVIQRTIHQEIEREVPNEPERVPLQKKVQITESTAERAPLQPKNQVTTSTDRTSDRNSDRDSDRGTDNGSVKSTKPNDTKSLRSILCLKPNRSNLPTKAGPVEKLVPEQPLISSGTKVFVTFVVDYNSVYVIPQKNMKDYSSIVNDVDSYAKKQQKFSGDVEKGGYAAAPLKSGTYARVIVLNAVDKNMVPVAFIDYGNISEVNKTELRPLSDELIVRNRYSRKVLLKDLTDEFNCPEFYAFLKQMKGDRILFELRYSGEFDQRTTECQLINDKGKTVQQMFIAELNPPVEKAASEVKIDDPEVPNKKISGNNIQMTILDKSMLQFGIVSALLIDDVQQFGDNDTKINEYCEKLPNIECRPRTGGLCFAQWSDGVDEPRWYRGHCLEYHGKNPKILFLDYGNFETIEPKNIRAAPEEFYFECITASIVLEDIPTASDGSVSLEIQKLLNENLPEVITFEKVTYNEEDQTSCATSAEIVKLLKDAKLI